MESGGYEAMLHELLHYNLAEFNVRRVPATDGLQTQRKLTLGTSESWWLDVLQRGYVFQSKLGLGEIFCEWMQSVTTELLFTSYSAFAFEKRERAPDEPRNLRAIYNRYGRAGSSAVGRAHR